MPGDRTIEPSAARLRRGWRAGVRGQSRWLDAAAGLAGVGLVLGAIPWSRVSGIGERWRDAVADPAHSGAFVVEVSTAALALAAALAVAFVLARAISAALAGRLGPVDRAGLRRLAPARSAQGAASLVLLAAVATLTSVAALQGIVAGAARASDATAAGTLHLWLAWPQRTWAICLVVLVATGVGELVLSHRRIRAQLAQTPAQARDERRRRGGR